MTCKFGYVDRYPREFTTLQERVTKQSRKLSSHSLTKQLQRAPEVTSKCGTNNNKDKSDIIAHPAQGNLRILDLRRNKSCNSFVLAKRTIPN